MEDTVLHLHVCHGSRGSAGKERDISKPYLSYMFKEFQSHHTDLCGQLSRIAEFLLCLSNYSFLLWNEHTC